MFGPVVVGAGSTLAAIVTAAAWAFGAVSGFWLVAMFYGVGLGTPVLLAVIGRLGRTG